MFSMTRVDGSRSARCADSTRATTAHACPQHALPSQLRNRRVWRRVSGRAGASLESRRRRSRVGQRVADERLRSRERRCQGARRREGDRGERRRRRRCGATDTRRAKRAVTGAVQRSRWRRDRSIESGSRVDGADGIVAIGRHRHREERKRQHELPNQRQQAGGTPNAHTHHPAILARRRWLSRTSAAPHPHVSRS